MKSSRSSFTVPLREDRPVTFVVPIRYLPARKMKAGEVRIFLTILQVERRPARLFRLCQ